ncbi:MAG: alpha/beta hydrolase [Gemmatimonadales bacterium]
MLSSGQSIRSPDVAYGSDSRQRLDVYRPRARGNPAPVVVFLYGGRWQSGSKDQYRLLGDALARRGVVVVVPDYRLYPEVKFPAWVEDAAQAVKWTRNNIERLGGDTARIWMVGHSSGAHTAVLLALDDRYLRDAGLPANAMRGYVSIAGPVDTVWTDADVQALMGPPEGWPATYPRTHIREERETNLLFLHGSQDKTVSASNSITLAVRIRKSGGCARAVVYRGVGHVEIVVAFSVPQLGIAPVMSDVLDFIHQPRTKKCTNGHGCCPTHVSNQSEKSMAEQGSGYKHDSSDRKLDQSAEAANESGQTSDTQHSSGAGHDREEIAKHDDAGKDRLFEGRQQHDDAEKNSEKTRLAKDVADHHHPVDEAND